MHKSDAKIKFLFLLYPCKAPSDFKQTDQILVSSILPIPLLLYQFLYKSDNVYEHNEIFFSSLRRQPTPLNVFMYPDRTVTVLHIIDNTSMSTTHSTLMHIHTHISTIITNSLLHFFSLLLIQMSLLVSE